MTFVWTASLLASNCGFQLLVINNAQAQTGWFYAFGSNILMIIQGIAQVLSSLAVVEISPPGFEASVYEFLTTMHNAGITLNTNLQNLFVPVFKLNGIEHVYKKELDMRHEFNTRMNYATYFTMAVNLMGAFAFCMFLPKNKDQCKVWAAAWRKPCIGILNLTVGTTVLLFSITISLLSVFPATNCLQIAGGQGC